MYLTASKINQNNFLTDWKGKSGKFVRTFGMNTTRNNNEWRVTWESIKQHINTALGMPGIEYEKCQEDKCYLDHVEAESFEESIQKQKPFERTKIIDYILDEENESVDLIHKVNDNKKGAEFFKKLQNGNIQYVSAMVWPATGGFDIFGKGRANLPILDAYHWKYVHHAFLKDDPAYGKDTAKVKTTCEGEDCQVKLLSAKLVAETTSDPGTDLDPLKEIPLLYRHKDNLHLVSASDCVKKIIKKKKDSGIEITDKELSMAYSECDDINDSKNYSNNNAKSSFKTCTCDANQNKMADDDKVKELESKLKSSDEEKKELQSKLKANDDNKEKEMTAKNIFNMGRNPVGFMTGVMKALPILGGILAAKEIAEFVVDEIAKIDRFFKKFIDLVDERVDAFRSLQEQANIQAGLSQRIITTASGSTEPRYSYNTFDEFNNNQSEHERKNQMINTSGAE